MSATQDWILVQRGQQLMATQMAIYVAVPPDRQASAEEAIADAFAWLAEVGARLTRFTAESELSQLNAAAGEWRAVSDMLFAVVEESLAAARATDGLFDPALLPLLEALGYDRDFKAIAHRESADEWRVARGAAGPGSWREIELDRDGRRVRLPPGARLDLGGITKGWAADVALERFFAEFDNVLVDAGGDLRARGGNHAGGAWPIGIGDPFGASPAASSAGPEAHVAVLSLGRGGLATSGAIQRWWYRAGERQHHLLDPRTGRPARVWIDAADEQPGEPPLIATATALAPTAAHAEVAAKVALLRGYPRALGLVEQAWKELEAGARPEDGPIAIYEAYAARDAHPGYADAPVALLLVLGDGKVSCSTNLRQYLATFGAGGELWLD